MSQKRRLSCSSTGGGGNSGGLSPNTISATKEPKNNQQQTTLLEQFEKNGKVGMAVEDSNGDMMFMEGVEDYLASTGSYPAGPASAVTLSSSPVVGTTANLTRKKATRPQPVKKLVIKPFKDISPSSVSVSSAEQWSEDEEMHDADQEPLQGSVETPPVKEEESAPTRPHRKSTVAQHVNMPAKIKRLNGHSTLTHRQGCLCVVCVGRRKREAKLRKSGGAHSKSNKTAKKKSGGPNSGDRAVEGEEDFTFAGDGEDALNGYPPSDNFQGYTSNNYQLPLRKLDPYVVEMSRILLGSKPGSIWNRSRSLGYVAVPLPGRSVGIADAISFMSH